MTRKFHFSKDLKKNYCAWLYFLRYKFMAIDTRRISHICILPFSFRIGPVLLVIINFCRGLLQVLELTFTISWMFHMVPASANGINLRKDPILCANTKNFSLKNSDVVISRKRTMSAKLIFFIDTVDWKQIRKQKGQQSGRRQPV